MYSRSYGRGDISAKITPPPAYSGSAIQGKEPPAEKEERRAESGAFAPFSQNIPLPKSEGEAEKYEPCEKREPCEKYESCEVRELCGKREPPREEKCAESPRKEKGLLSSLLPDLSKEDLILIGIVIALAFDLADRDILLVALVAAAVIM